MKTLLKISLLLTLLTALSVPMLAQTATPRTTLTNAITSSTGTITVTVGSTTGILPRYAGGAPTGALSTQGFCLIEGELLQVNSITSATVMVLGGRTNAASTHPAGAEVRCGPGGYNFNTATGASSGVFVGANSRIPAGSCTRSAQQFLPVFYNDGGLVTAFDCPNSVSSTTGTWISWQYHPGTSEVAARTPMVATATSYTALVSDYLIDITTAFTPNNATFTVTLPCASVPAGKVWIVRDSGGDVGTTGNGISIIGAFLDTQQILAGYTAKAYSSNGTNCFRLW